MGQPLLFSCQCWQCEERGYSDGSTLTYDSSVLPCLHGCLVFLHGHFLLQSSPSDPLGPCLHSQQQTSPWNCSTIPMLQLPTAVPSRGAMSLSRVHMAAARIICVIFIPFRLSHISCFTLSFKCFSSVPKNCPDGRDQTPAPFPPPTKGRSSSTHSPLFPSTSYVLPSFVWSYIFFFSGQVLLPTLRGCSGSSSVSKGVYLMYPWREMYSTSSYLSAILFSSWFDFLSQWSY